MHCIRWFWGLMPKLGNQWALCLVLAAHQLGEVFEKASSSCVPHWNKIMALTLLKKKTNHIQKKHWDWVLLCISLYWLKFICRLCAAIRTFLYCRRTLWGLSLLNLRDMGEGNVKCLSWWDLQIILTRSSRGNLAQVLSLQVTLRSIFLAVVTVWIIFNPNTVGFICMVIFNRLNSLASSVTTTWKQVTSDKCCCKNQWMSGHCFNHQKKRSVQCAPNQTEWLCV